MSNKMSFLERAGSITLMTTLSKHKGKMYVTELQKEIGKGSLSTLNMRILELQNIGMINQKVENKFGGRKYIWLTAKGEKVAHFLRQINDSL